MVRRIVGRKAGNRHTEQPYGFLQREATLNNSITTESKSLRLPTDPSIVRLA